MLRGLPPQNVIAVEDDQTLETAASLFKEHGISQMPCTTGGRLSGIVTEIDLLRFLVEGRRTSTSLAELMVRRVSTVSARDEAKKLPEIFERGEVAIVVDDAHTVAGTITKMDFIDFVAKRGPGHL